MIKVDSNVSRKEMRYTISSCHVYINYNSFHRSTHLLDKYWELGRVSRIFDSLNEEGMRPVN